MSPLLRKEARLLLPAWIAALAAATFPLFPWDEFRTLSGYFFIVALVALALSPFGLETSHGTFGLLLVQPDDRRRFWRIKTGLLAIALALVMVLFTWTFFLNFWSHGFQGQMPPYSLEWGVLMVLLAYSGGLWTTLLLRDMVSSFFCTLLVPVAISGSTFAVYYHWVDIRYEHDDVRFGVVLFCVLAVYAVAGFLWARRLFLGAQDVAWTGGQISLTVRGVPLRWLAFGFKGRQNRWTALVKKELQLQEVTMALIPILALLHLTALVLHHFAPTKFPDDLAFTVIPIIWGASVPLVIGCVAVAEERRLNTLESSLCLPLTKSGQFAVKLVVALVLGVVLGGVVPWALMRMNGLGHGEFQLRYALGIVAAITGIAFYGSTMSRSLLQALPTALCIPTVVAVIFDFIGVQIRGYGNTPFTRSLLLPALLWPAAVITLVWLAFRNYKRLQIGWRVWVGDLARAGAVAGCVTLAALAIFDRSWELFQTLEPPHGPARISGSGRPEIGVSRSNLVALLPDGRLRIGEQTWMGKGKERKFRGISWGFASDSNWTKLATGYGGVIALKSTGSLWKIQSASDIRQFGSNSDWKEVATDADTFLAVKQDGTLWGWGINRNEILRKQQNTKERVDEIAEPIRIGDDHDWVNAFLPRATEAMGVKRDGSVWIWGELNEYEYPRTAARIEHQPVRCKMEGTNWVSVVGSGYLTLGLYADGSLWAVGNIPPRIFGQSTESRQNSEVIRVGSKTDWLALSGEWQFAAIEADGTLWAMECRLNQQCVSKRPSKYSDWLAATEHTGQTWSLAKDGTLTCWNVFYVNEPQKNNPTFLDNFFLSPTRRPIFSVNILEEQK